MGIKKVYKTLRNMSVGEAVKIIKKDSPIDAYLCYTYADVKPQQYKKLKKITL